MERRFVIMFVVLCLYSKNAASDSKAKTNNVAQCVCLDFFCSDDIDVGGALDDFNQMTSNNVKIEDKKSYIKIILPANQKLAKLKEKIRLHFENGKNVSMDNAFRPFRTNDVIKSGTPLSKIKKSIFTVQNHKIDCSFCIVPQEGIDYARINIYLSRDGSDKKVYINRVLLNNNTFNTIIDSDNTNNIGYHNSPKMSRSIHSAFGTIEGELMSRSMSAQNISSERHHNISIKALNTTNTSNNLQLIDNNIIHNSNVVNNNILSIVNSLKTQGLRKENCKGYFKIIFPDVNGLKAMRNKIHIYILLTS